jgi:ATP-binding cassette subfamily F protein 3
MRMLSGEEAPDSGERREGHHLVMQYFAQDEATRLDPAPTVYETLASGSPNHMVPTIRNILGGFLFSGDDVYKRVRVLSGGERTRLAVARMLLRPSNTLLLDEPTNHLDLDSKEVLLDALVDYGGTLLFVSHDRYFVERLATKIIEVGNGTAVVYPGTYKEFLWHKEHPIGQDRPGGGTRGDPSAQAREGSVRATSAKASLEPAPQRGRPQRREGSLPPDAQGLRPQRREENQALRASKKGQHRDRVAEPIENSREEKKRADTEARRRSRADQARRARIDDLETRIADCENAIRDIETTMAAPGFYEDRTAAQPIIDRHQALMWTVGDLMHQWEQLQSGSDIVAAN